MDKIDTQGMSIPGEASTEPVAYSPMPVRKMTIFTDQERKELKEQRT